MDELTYKQKRFVQFYNGNGTEAARQAGYGGSDNVLAQIASDNLRKKPIQDAISSRDTAIEATVTANRHARLRFWTEVMCDENQSIKDRLRASELLAKAEGDFSDPRSNDPTKPIITLEQAAMKAYERRKQLNADKNEHLKI